jgi:hypothetical protein
MQCVGFNSEQADLKRKYFCGENVTDDELSTREEMLHSIEHFLEKKLELELLIAFDACDRFGCLCNAESLVI